MQKVSTRQLTDDRRSNSAWTLTLELETTGQQRYGIFSLYRKHSDNPLLIDINNSDFGL